MRLEANGYALWFFGLRLQAPRVNESMGRLHDFEHTDDPHERAVGKSIRDSIRPTDPQVDLGTRACGPLRAPPLSEMRRFRPGREQLFWRCVNDSPHDERCDVSVVRCVDRWFGHICLLVPVRRTFSLCLRIASERFELLRPE